MAGLGKTAAAAAEILLRKNGVVPLGSFGVEADFASALQRAVAQAASGGGVVVGVPGKTYYARSKSTFTDIDTRIDLSMCKVVRSDDFSSHDSAPANPYSAAPIIEIIHSHGTPATVSGALSTTAADLSGGEGTTTVTRLPLASTAGYAVGDVVQVYDPSTLIPWDSATDEYIGESARVAVVNAGSLDLDRVLELHSYFTTTTKVAKKSNYVCELALWAEDPAGWYENADTAVKYRRNRPMVTVTGAVNPWVEKVKFRGLMAEGLEMKSCYEPIVNTLDCSRIRTSSTYYAYGYGVTFTGCTRFKLLNPVRGDRVRHLVTSRAPNPASPSTAAPEEFGGVVCGEIDCRALSGAEHSIYDMHPDAYNVHYKMPYTSGQHRGPSAGQYGIQLRGCGHEVTNFLAEGYGAMVIAPALRPGGSLPKPFRVQGRVYRRAGLSPATALVSVGDNGQADRTKVTLELDIVADDGTAELVAGTNAEITFSGKIDWAFTGTSAARVFKLTNTLLTILPGSIFDLSRGSGTNARLVKFDDANSVVRAISPTIKTTVAGTFVFADFDSSGAFASTIIVERAQILQGRTSNSGVSNGGASSVYKIDIASSDSGVDHSIWTNSTNYSTSGNKTISSFDGRHEPIFEAVVGATLAGAVITTVPAGSRPGQMCIWSNRRASTSQSLDVTLNSVTRTLAVGASSMARWDDVNSVWRWV